MIKKEILEACYFLHGEQNTEDQRKKRLGEGYCPLYIKYIRDIFKECTKEKCPYYYSVDQMIADRI